MGWFSFKPETTILGNVKDEHLTEIRRFVKEKTGAELPHEDAAVVQMGGWDVTWSYNRAACELSLTVNRKPKWPPMWAVREAIRNEMEKYGVVEVNRVCGIG